MMSGLTYRDINSPVHRMGAGPKMALLGSLAIFGLIYSDLIFLSTLIVICLVITRISGVWENVVSLLRAFLYFSVLVFIINLLVNQHGSNILFETSFRFYFWNLTFRITGESATAALRMVLRLYSVIQAFLLFSLTTKPEIVLNKISEIKTAGGLGVLLALAYRFIPTILSDGSEIKDSLRTRGVKFEQGGRFERLRAYASLAIPLVTNSLDRSLQLAEAMESRGYGGDRSSLRVDLMDDGRDLMASIFYLVNFLIFISLWALLGVGRAEFVSLSWKAAFSPLMIFLFLVPILIWRGPDD